MLAKTALQILFVRLLRTTGTIVSLQGVTHNQTLTTSAASALVWTTTCSLTAKTKTNSWSLSSPSLLNKLVQTKGKSNQLSLSGSTKFSLQANLTRETHPPPHLGETRWKTSNYRFSKEKRQRIITTVKLSEVPPTRGKYKVEQWAQ